GLLRLVGGRSLGEGGGLALADPLLLFEQAGQPLHLGFQLGDAALQRLAAGAGRSVHAGRIGKGTAPSCAAGEPSKAQAGAQVIARAAFLSRLRHSFVEGPDHEAASFVGGSGNRLAGTGGRSGPARRNPSATAAGGGRGTNGPRWRLSRVGAVDAR